MIFIGLAPQTSAYCSAIIHTSVDSVQPAAFHSIPIQIDTLIKIMLRLPARGQAVQSSRRYHSYLFGALACSSPPVQQKQEIGLEIDESNFHAQPSEFEYQIQQTEEQVHGETALLESLNSIIFFLTGKL